MKFGWISLYLVFLWNIVNCKYFADEVNSVVYDLSISSFPMQEGAKDQQFESSTSDSAANPAVPIDLMTISNKYGQNYQCRFPAYMERLPGSDEGLLDPPTAPKVTTEEIREVLDPDLKGLCFKNTRDKGGWWTYEFCYKDAIMQYHLDNENKRVGETIYLGRFESEKDWSTPEAIAELSSKRKKTLYHSHYFTNGSVCDLTKSFRRAEVRFMCSEELVNGAFLHSVDEPESCEYVLTIYTAALCRLPAFLPADRKPPGLKIECQPVLTAPEYDKYMKAKQAEEAKKAEEAARKKEEQELKKKIEAEKKKYQKPNSQKSSAAPPAPEPSAVKSQPQRPKKPILYALGRSKPDFMKPILAREAAIAAGKSVEEADKEASEAEGGERLLGAVGTIEYEFLTHWLEQELQDLVTDESAAENEEILDSEKDLSELEKYAVNEFKRKTRRVSLMVAFRARVEEMIDDVFFSVTQYDPRVKNLRGHQLRLAKQEVEAALTAAVTNLIAELDEVEREMEMLDEKTDLSGVAAFVRMREMVEGRQRLLKELEDSKLDPADFIKAKLATMRESISDEDLANFEATDDPAADAPKDAMATHAKKVVSSSGDGTEAARSAKSDPDVSSSVPEGKKQDALSKDAKETAPAPKSAHAEIGEPGQGSGNVEHTNEAVSDSTKLAKGKSFRQEMAEQLGNIMGDVERELKEDGVFDNLNEAEMAEVKTEAFRSLARTLTNLLEKLDESERGIDQADEQLEVDAKLPKTIKSSKSTPKSSKVKDTEKKLELWRKLIQGLEEEEQAKSSATPERTPLGKIQVKRGDATDSKSGTDNGVRVRVSTIKRKEPEVDSNGDETGDGSEASKLERRLADKLKDAGFDTQGRPVQVKIITNFDLDDSDNLLHTLSEEESEQFTNVIYAILGGVNVEQTAEQRRQESLENSYNFGGSTDSDEAKEKPGPMKTVTVGGRRP